MIYLSIEMDGRRLEPRARRNSSGIAAGCRFRGRHRRSAPLRNWAGAPSDHRQRRGLSRGASRKCACLPATSLPRCAGWRTESGA